MALIERSSLRQRNQSGSPTVDDSTQTDKHTRLDPHMDKVLQPSPSETLSVSTTHNLKLNLLHSSDSFNVKGGKISGKASKLQLYRFEELPAYLQDNEFIRTGYRCYYTYRESWMSIFCVHNETGNIHTHMWAFIGFIGLFIQSLYGLPLEADRWDHSIIALFLLSACKCFLFSTLFHTHFCNSKEAFVKFGCLDYAGISILICGSASIVTYYAFYCNFLYRTIWLGLLGSISSVGIFGPMFSIWATPRFRIWRTLIYVSSGVLSGLPVFHFLIRYGVPWELSWWGFYGWFIMIFMYLGGAFIYAMKIPERWAPGKFDYFLHSHQLWHVCVVSAAYCHYLSSVELLKWRLQQGCLAS